MRKKSVLHKSLILFGAIGFHFLFTLGYAEEVPKEEKMEISADHIDFNEQITTLKGNAEIIHPLGMLTADLMVFSCPSKTEDIPFDLLEMKGDVAIHLSEGGRLYCATAIFDYAELTGVFLSDRGKEKVMYLDKISQEEGQIPIAMESLKMEMHLSPNLNQKDRKGFSLQTIIADQEVSMHYDDRFHASSDHAVFKRTLDEKVDPREFAGVVTLTSQPPRLCRLISTLNDEIFSREIIVDILTRELKFAFPRGSLKSAGETPVEFKAKKLVWNDLLSILTFSEDVEICFEGIGKLQTPNDIQLTLGIIDGKKIPKTVETYGAAILTYTSPDKQLEHVLKSYGSLFLDHQKMEAKLQSPQTSDKIVVEGRQVFFQDDKGQIYADKVFVKYDYVDKKILPVRLVLQGNVKITNHLKNLEKDRKPANQYILADRVDFIPKTNEMLLKAAKGGRVLFFDKVNHLEVSAPGLKLIRDKTIRKETVQGLGDVRFSFIDSEFDQFRRYFSLDQIISGSKNSEENK